jgi:hypothetical protein
MNYLETAKRRWTTHCIGGSGRFAVYSPSMGPLSKILLCETRAKAEAQIVDPKLCLVVDLAFDTEAALERMRDPETAEERRARRREAREAFAK